MFLFSLCLLRVYFFVLPQFQNVAVFCPSLHLSFGSTVRKRRLLSAFARTLPVLVLVSASMNHSAQRSVFAFAPIPAPVDALWIFRKSSNAFDLG